MKRIWIATLLMASMLTTAAVAQTQSQNTGGNNASQSGQRNTSGADGLKRKGSANPGPMGSPKMQNGVSRNGNTNLSPTSQTNVPPPGGDKPSAKPSTAPKTGGSQNGGAKSSGSATKSGAATQSGVSKSGGATQSGATKSGGTSQTGGGNQGSAMKSGSGGGSEPKSASKEAAMGLNQVRGTKPTSTSTSGNPTTTASKAPSAKDKAIGASMMKESAEKRQKLGSSGTNNGNGGKAPEAPLKTQGSTSEGDASVASPGGAQGTRAKEARSVQPKSRAAMMASGKKPAPAPGGQPVKAKN
jgi:hypothetical protein